MVSGEMFVELAVVVVEAEIDFQLAAEVAKLGQAVPSWQYSVRRQLA